MNYYAESPLLLEGPLFLQAGRNAPYPARIASKKIWNDTVIIRLEGVDDRTRAEQFRGQALLVPASALPEPDPDAPYILDIIDLPVFDTQSGERIGVLEEVFYPSDQETWIIRAPGGEEILFPAVPEFVDDIDLDNERIEVSPPPGLLDIYLTGKS